VTQISYAAPGDMTVVAWYAWAVVTDPDGTDRIERYSSQEGATWDDVPDDGVLGIKLLHAAMLPDGNHYSVQMIGADWYFKADSTFGDVWGYTDKPEEDLAPGRYRNPKAKHGKWIAKGRWLALLQEMSGVLR